jgi:hypothetical protein
MISNLRDLLLYLLGVLSAALMILAGYDMNGIDRVRFLPFEVTLAFWVVIISAFYKPVWAGLIKVLGYLGDAAYDLSLNVIAKHNRVIPAAAKARSAKA